MLYGTSSIGGWRDSTLLDGTVCGVVFSYALEPNYVGLAGFPSPLAPGDAAPFAWACDFSRWDYEGDPVDVYLAVVTAPRVGNAPSSLGDVLSGGPVFVLGARGWYLFEGRIGEPTLRAVTFLPGAASGMLTVPTLALPSVAGEYALAAVFAYSDGSGFVRTDGRPVENSNVVTFR